MLQKGYTEVLRPTDTSSLTPKNSLRAVAQHRHQLFNYIFAQIL